MSDELTLLERFTLVLLRESAMQEVGGLRCWKGYDWQVMNRLHEKGLITDPVGRAKSVFLTDEGRKRAEGLVEEYVGEPYPTREAAHCACGLCREPNPSGGFKPGHDQKLRAHLESRVGGLLALRDLVEAAEAYASGQANTEELTRQVRAVFGNRE